MPDDRTFWVSVAIAVGLLIAGWMGVGRAPDPQLDLGTTTSTADSGLLDYILPGFERSSGTRVRVIAVGTGQALAYGARGEVDVVLVHAPALEEKFVAAGHGIDRRPVFHNRFIIVGPAGDPAGVAGTTNASAALARIAEAGARFVSRGDESGTHAKELELWTRAGIATPVPGEAAWYLSVGQGMAQTLRAADELAAYTLADSATFAALSPQLSLTILVDGDPTLRNPYHVIRVDPRGHPGVHGILAERFADWITSNETRAQVDSFRVNGEQVFQSDAG